MKSIVAENIERLVSEKGLKKRVVAERADITPQMLSDMLSGRRTIKDEYILPIAEALDVTPNELFGFKKTDTPN